MTKKAAISEQELSERWHTFRLKFFRKLEDAVRQAKNDGIDQKSIAERIGMSEAQLSRVLSGRQNVTLRTMHNIARAIDHRPEIDFISLASLVPTNVPQRYTKTVPASTSSTAATAVAPAAESSSDRYKVPA